MFDQSIDTISSVNGSIKAPPQTLPLSSRRIISTFKPQHTHTHAHVHAETLLVTRETYAIVHLNSRYLFALAIAPTPRYNRWRTITDTVILPQLYEMLVNRQKHKA